MCRKLLKIFSQPDVINLNVSHRLSKQLSGVSRLAQGLITGDWSPGIQYFHPRGTESTSINYRTTRMNINQHVKERNRVLVSQCQFKRVFMCRPLKRVPLAIERTLKKKNCCKNTPFLQCKRPKETAGIQENAVPRTSLDSLSPRRRWQCNNRFKRESITAIMKKSKRPQHRTFHGYYLNSQLEPSMFSLLWMNRKSFASETATLGAVGEANHILTNEIELWWPERYLQMQNNYFVCDSKTIFDPVWRLHNFLIGHNV